MSCCIAHIKDGKVFIGSDSANSRGEHQEVVTLSKIHLGKDYIMAGAGSLIDVQQFSVILSKYEESLWNTGQIYELYKLLVKEKKETSDAKMDSTFIVGCKNEFYTVDPDGCVQEHNTEHDEGRFYCIGSGMAYAYGALYAGATIEKALEAAAEFDIYTKGPFTIMSL